MNIREVIEKMPLLCKIDPSSKSKIITYAVPKTYKKGDCLFFQRDKVERIYIIVSGYAVLKRVNRNNDTRAIFVFSEGDIVNEVILEEPVSSISCYALSDLEVISFTRTQFLEIMEQDFYFTRLLIESMAMKIRRLYHQVENTTKMMKLERQIISRLIKLVRDFGVHKKDYIEIPFPITITFLADLVGSNRETVSRVVKKLSSQDILSIQNSKCIIYDVEALRDSLSENK